MQKKDIRQILKVATTKDVKVKRVGELIFQKSIFVFESLFA